MPTQPANAPASRLSLRTTVRDDGTVVECHGRLTVEVSSDFKQQVKEMISKTPRLVLDLSGITYMDSSGLGAIVAIFVSAKAARCSLQLVNLSQQIRKLLAMTRVISLFESCGEYNVRMP
jgi:anti-sigma B factor antagonist